MKLFPRLTAATSMTVAALTLAGGAAGAAGVDTSLSRARAATARYHLPALAVADGFVSDGECVAEPSGGMGVHWVNEGRIDSVVNATQPEVLLYEPGRRFDRLVGLEYVAIAPVGQPPVLFGQPFEYGQDIGDGNAIYALHVSLWRHNPSGMFAPYNPNVHCPPGGGSHAH